MRLGGPLLFVCLLLSLLPAIAAAEPEIGLRGAGGTLGLYDPESWDAAIGFGGFVDLGTLKENVGLEGNVDFWSKSEESQVFLAKLEFSLRDLAIGGTVKYYMGESDAAFLPFAGGGLGLHFVKAEVKGTDPTDEEDFSEGSASSNATKLGLDLVGGAVFGSGERVRFLAELRYRVISDWSQVILRGGVTFALGD